MALPDVNSRLCGPSDLKRLLSERPELKAELEEREEKYRVGLWRWRPRFLQVFRNAVTMTVLLFTFATLEGSLVSGLTSVVLSSIERRYQFSSVMTGLIASTFDITVALCIIPVSYFGGRGNKPRWLGIGAIIHGVGALVFALPQFVAGPYQPSVSGLENEFCNGEMTVDQCSETSPSWVYCLFIFGNILMGIGASPIFTVGTAFLDDLVWPRKTPIFLGVFYIATVVGPALGFVLGGTWLQIYVDPLTPTTLIDTDPAYVGAWWLGFIIIGILVILSSVPILMFPRELPESHLICIERKKDMVLEFTDGSSESGLLAEVKEAPKHLRQVLSSPTWVYATLSVALQAISIVGLTTFGPKYLEVQYSLSSSVGSYLAGGIGIGGAAVGIATGALIIYCAKSTGKRAAFISFISSLISTLLVLGVLFHCPNANVVGLPNNGSAGYLLTVPSPADGTCSVGCGCDSTTYTPVCDGSTGLTHFSPCHAGCVNLTEEGDYSNCSCAFQTNGSFSQVTEGRCPNGCPYLPVLLIVLLLFFITTFAGEIPGLLVVMRSVAEEQRTFSLGVQSLVFRALGTIPGPLLFGVIFDSACILWQYECGSRGNCWEYNNTNLTVRLFILAMLTNIANTIFILFGWLSFGYTWHCKKVDRVENGDGQIGSRPTLERQSTELQMLTVADGGKPYDRSFSVESANGNVPTSNGGVAIEGGNGTGANNRPATPNMAGMTGDESRSSTGTGPASEIAFSN